MNSQSTFDSSRPLLEHHGPYGGSQAAPSAFGNYPAPNYPASSGYPASNPTPGNYPSAGNYPAPGNYPSHGNYPSPSGYPAPEGYPSQPWQGGASQGPVAPSTGPWQGGAFQGPSAPPVDSQGVGSTEKEKEEFKPMPMPGVPGYEFVNPNISSKFFVGCSC